VILHTIQPSTPLRSCSCGTTPDLIEARGRTLVDPRLLCMPATAWHVECRVCGVATPPSYSRTTAEFLWHNAHRPQDFVRLEFMRAARIDAERRLLLQAAQREAGVAA
jgi:hypothetical protein